MILNSTRFPERRVWKIHFFLLLRGRFRVFVSIILFERKLFVIGLFLLGHHFVFIGEVLNAKFKIRDCSRALPHYWDFFTNIVGEKSRISLFKSMNISENNWPRKKI